MQACILILLLFIAWPVLPASAEPRLTLKECIDLARANQPSLKAAEQNVNAGLGREAQTRSAYFPQLTASAGYSKSVSEGGAFGNSSTNSSTLTLSLNQVIYDFGRTGNSLDAARWNTHAWERERERTFQEVVLNVKQAYFALLAAKNVALVAEKRVELTEAHLRQADAFFRAGSKPRFEVTRAEVDVNTARLALINATSNVRIRTIALNNAMGVDPGRPTEIEDTFPPVPDMPALAQAQEEALRNRPELLKAEADIKAAQARVRTEESNFYPTLSASGAYTWASGTQDMGSLPLGTSDLYGRQLVGDIGNSWNAGITLSLPLFQGGVTRGRVSEARANMIALEAQRSAVVQSVLLELNQSYADLESAQVRIGVMDSSFQKARENMELAQGRYEAGVGQSIDVTDAQLSAAQAAIDLIQAKYDHQLSMARLLKAMGRTDD